MQSCQICNKTKKELTVIEYQVNLNSVEIKGKKSVCDICKIAIDHFVLANQTSRILMEN